MAHLIFYAIAFALNVPFGFFRKPLSQKASSRVVKFIIMMLLIHIPIPIVIMLRSALEIERDALGIALSVGVCVLGQAFGSRVIPKLIPCRQKA